MADNLTQTKKLKEKLYTINNPPPDGGGGSSIPLGETAGTAYFGDKGKKNADNITEIEQRLDKKANASSLAKKADKTELDGKADKTELAKKADKTALDGKVDKTILNSELAKKANASSLAKKADKTELDGKADKTELAKKADKTALDGKVDKTTLSTELAKKADIATLAGAWQNVGLLNAWEADSPVQIKMSLDKEVSIKGNVKKGILGTQVFRVSEVFRPSRDISFVTKVDGKVGEISINSDGFVVVSNDTTNEAVHVSMEVDYAL